jgi:hypothetical protein
VTVKLGATDGPKAAGAKNLTVSQYTTKSLTPGKNYFWRVKACNVIGCSKSEWSKFKVSSGATLELHRDDSLLDIIHAIAQKIGL